MDVLIATKHDISVLRSHRPAKPLVPPPARAASPILAALLCLAAAGCGAPGRRLVGPAPPEQPSDPPSTFSIVAFDPETGDLGVAVQSKFFGVGAVVPWAEAGVGAIATQSYANTTYGPRGLSLLREGKSPEEVIAALTAPDAEKEFRQVGVVDAQGRSASFTGSRCIPWAGARSGQGFTAQGNLLVSQACVDAMARAFAEARGSLAERLVASLDAGQQAGGDARGRQSAAVLVVRKKAGYGGFNDRYVDLRVDDHRDPIRELARLVRIQVGKDPISLSRKLEHQGHLEEALRVVEEASSRDPGWDAPRFEAAKLLFRLARTDDARTRLQAAVAIDPAYDHQHFLAAQILAQAGLEADALKEVERACVLNPEYKHVLRRELESPSSAFAQMRMAIEGLLVD